MNQVQNPKQVQHQEKQPPEMRKLTNFGTGGRAGREGASKTPMGRPTWDHLEKARWESLDLVKGSLVERTNAPNSASDEADSIRLSKRNPVDDDSTGGSGPLGPQNLFSLMGNCLQALRPDQGVYWREEEEFRLRVWEWRWGQEEERRVGHKSRALSWRRCIILPSPIRTAPKFVWPMLIFMATSEKKKTNVKLR